MRSDVDRAEVQVASLEHPGDWGAVQPGQVRMIFDPMEPADRERHERDREERDKILEGHRFYGMEEENDDPDEQDAVRGDDRDRGGTDLPVDDRHGDSGERPRVRSSDLSWYWASKPDATIGFEVKEGIVVAVPPYGRKWLLGLSEEAALAALRADGWDVKKGGGS